MVKVKIDTIFYKVNCPNCGKPNYYSDWQIDELVEGYREFCDGCKTSFEVEK